MTNANPKLFRSILLSTQAGVLGGMAAGILEVILITRFGSVPTNFSGLLFALVAYGIMGGCVGLGLHFLLWILSFLNIKLDIHRLAATILSGTFSAVIFLIVHFRTFRDFHDEKVRHTSAVGILTMVVLVVGAGVLYLFVRFILNRLKPNWLVLFFKTPRYVAITSGIMIVGLLFHLSLTKGANEVYSPFSPGKQSDLKDKPNIVWILSDTHRPDYLGCYGNTAIATPNIDGLAHDGVIFDQVYAHSTHTKASTASMLSSLYPSEHRAIHKLDALPSSVTMIAEILDQAGYYCGGIVTNNHVRPAFNFHQGFHEYRYLPPKYFFGANEAAARLVIYGVLRLIRLRLVESVNVENYYTNAEKVQEYYDDFLKRNNDKKFFLFLHYVDPHDPYFEHPYSGRGYAWARMESPDSSFVEPFKDFYTQDVEYIDRWIGQVIDQLKSAGLYDNSIIVYTSDHGEEFYEHKGWWHARTLYEEQLRIPLIIKKQANADGGIVDESLVRGIDITPTILAAVGIASPSKLRGRNLFDSLPDGSSPPELFAELDHGRNIVKMLRIGSWKYIETNLDNPKNFPPKQLFYLIDDPKEMKNLVASEPAKASEMKILLLTKYQEILIAGERKDDSELNATTHDQLSALGYAQ